MEPKLETLQEAIIYFSNPTNCREYVAARRWPNGIECPRCGNKKVTFLDKYNRWQCGARHANRQFTAKTGTIFEDSPLGLDKWLSAMWQVVNCKNGVSSYEVHRAIGVTQKTAWFMDHRIRFALQSGSITKLGGNNAPVEVDETFIGGKARFMHRSKRERLSSEGGMQGGHGKAVVMGLLERGGKVKTAVIPHRKQNIPEKIVRQLVEPGTEVHTDEFMGYNNLKDGYIHKVVNHLEGYVKENVHTNGIENFWSLLKRGLNGTYVAVEPFHLFRYVDEQVFRYNHRKGMNDGDRFDLAVRQIVGKRLTWSDLTGAEAQPSKVPF
jgi:transposase-like protein